METWAFSRAFWHPFGAHADERPAEILARKQREIDRNGWTLWSFQHRRPEMLATWHRELACANGKVIAICSDSPNARPPGGSSAECIRYKRVGEDKWHALPPGIRVPHPFGRSDKDACAFVIDRIVYPIDFSQLPAVEWLARGGEWRTDRVPTRGEYLMRRGGMTPMRQPLAILELRAPFVVVVAVVATRLERLLGIDAGMRPL